MKPPMGWASWNTFNVNVNEELIKETVDIIVKSGMKDAGYEYVLIDDGWEAISRDSHGNLVPDPDKFPAGMKAIADYIHSRGLKFGMHNCAGTKTCSGFPGGRGHEYQDARTYASWDVDYFKYDWCATGKANAEETYKTMRDALYAAGRPVVFSICEWGNNKPWTWAKDVGHLWRTTGDITNCYNCHDVYAMGWKFILDFQDGLEEFSGPDHWNDPDMLEVGNPGLSLNESRAHFSLWCILAAPLMAGNDLRNMDDDILKILTNTDVIAIDQDPLGKQGYKFMDHQDKEIWVKELSDDNWAVCFFNKNDNTSTFRINWDHLTFLNGEYEIRDLWKKQNTGTTKEDAGYDIESLDVLLLKLTKL